MNLSDFEIYKTIYEIKSLNKAAVILGYSQSNITTRLKALETEFNTLLFTRNHNGVNATENGVKLYTFINQTLNQMNKLKTNFSNATPTLLISELLFNFLVIEKKVFSINDILITSKKTSEIPEELNNHFYDFIITFNKLINNAYTLKSIKKLNVCFLQSNVIRKNESLPIFINNDLMCPLRNLTLELYKGSTNIIEVDSLQNILKLVENGQGISLLPQYLVRTYSFERKDSVSYDIEYFKYQYKS